VKYPNWARVNRDEPFRKKIGIFGSEVPLYEGICERTGHPLGQRYFLAYIMELADDICYCLSDIADAFEKRLVTSRDFKHEYRQLCRTEGVDVDNFLPEGPIIHFGFQISVKITRAIVDEAACYFANNLEGFLSGTEGEISESIPLGRHLACLKKFARQFIYTEHEVQRIEIAGSKIVEGLLGHYGRLLRMQREDFRYFIRDHANPPDRHLDTEWRIFNQLSKRMIRVYEHQSRHLDNREEWIYRARLVVDYISGLTDHFALETYQNFMGINL
jgi:dGTPase